MNLNFIPEFGIHCRIANSFTRLRIIFKGLSKDGGRADFSENLRASETCRMNLILKLSSQKYGFGIRNQRSGKNLFRIPDPGVKKAPDPGLATLIGTGVRTIIHSTDNSLL